MGEGRFFGGIVTGSVQRAVVIESVSCKKRAASHAEKPRKRVVLSSEKNVHLRRQPDFKPFVSDQRIGEQSQCQASQADDGFTQRPGAQCLADGQAKTFFDDPKTAVVEVRKEK